MFYLLVGTRYHLFQTLRFRFRNKTDKNDVYYAVFITSKLRIFFVQQV